jgi:peptide/nickel transport system substrate-binding protein
MASRGSWLVALGALAACTQATPPASEPVNVAVPYTLTTLDPHREASRASALLYSAYEALLDVDAALKPHPGLAESWSNPEERTWVFRLRQGVRFHDGAPLRAADVAFTLRRLLGDRSLESGYYLTDVADVRVTDERTIAVTTIRPAALLATRLAFVRIVREGSSPEALAHEVNGTGAYRVEAYVPGRELRFLRNAAYWGKPPPVERATVFLGQPAPAAAAGLLEGRFQVAAFDGGTPSRELPVGPDLESFRRNSLYVSYLAYDLGRATTPLVAARPNPFRDIRVRHALDFALDRARLGADPGDPADPATQLVPAGVLGFEPGISRPPTDRPRARALLREAGLASGFATTLHARAVVAAQAHEVSRQLLDVGIEVEVRVLGEAQYRELLAAGGSSFWIDTWSCATADAGELFENALHSFDPGRRLGLFNRSGHADPALDQAIEASARIAAPNARRIALQAVMRTATDQLLWIPLSVAPELFVVRRGVAFQPRASGAIRISDLEPVR